MSWKTQKEGQKVTVQARVEVIYPTDKKLYSRDGTTKIEFNVRVFRHDDRSFSNNNRGTTISCRYNRSGRWTNGLQLTRVSNRMIGCTYINNTSIILRNCREYICLTNNTWDSNIFSFVIGCDLFSTFNWTSFVDVTVAFPAIFFRGFLEKSHHPG